MGIFKNSTDRELITLIALDIVLLMLAVYSNMYSIFIACNVPLLLLSISYYLGPYHKKEYKNYAYSLLTKHFGVSKSSIHWYGEYKGASINFSNGVTTYIPDDYIADTLMVNDIQHDKNKLIQDIKKL